MLTKDAPVISGYSKLLLRQTKEKHRQFNGKS